MPAPKVNPETTPQCSPGGLRLRCPWAEAVKAAQDPDTEPGQAAPQGHGLHCMAGFFASEAQAQAAAHELRQQHGLHDRQRLLLGPSHRSWLSFRRQARAWTLGRHTEGSSLVSDAPLMATLGGIIVGLAAMIGVALEGLPVASPALLLLLLGPLLGAVAGWAASALTARSLQHRRFNRHIRRQLAAGRWVVLAHRLPWPQQAAAAALLREAGVGWCAVSKPWRPL